VTVAKNVVFAKIECTIGSAQLSGTIANDGSFAGKLGFSNVSGKFDGDRFQGIISASGRLDDNEAIFLERVR
jgi:hypothetical protein